MFGTTNGLDYIRELIIMDRLDIDHQKKHVKKLWEKNPVQYYEWKEWCIKLDKLPDFFGTHDNPIPIDESTL